MKRSISRCRAIFVGVPGIGRLSPLRKTCTRSAAATSTRHASKPGETHPEDQAVAAQLVDLDQPAAVATTHEQGQFFAPTTLPELTALYQAHPSATLLAGGTDVGLWVTKHYRDLPTVLYTGRVAELLTIDESDAWLDIGAAVTFADCVAVLNRHYPELADLWDRFASPPIRNAATLGGNIANGSPIGDSMPALLALGARLTLASHDSQREIALDELYLGYQQKSFGPGELLVRVRIPLRRNGLTLRSYKLSKRFDQDISAVCAAFALTIDGGRVDHAGIAYGGMAAIPKRAVEAEAVLMGADWNEATVRSAMAALARDFTPLTDMRASDEYRLKSAQNLLYRAFIETTNPETATDVYRFAL